MTRQAYLGFLAAFAVFAEPDAWNERMGLANRLQQQGRYAEARQLYLSAVSETERPGGNKLHHAQALNNLAAHYFELGRYSEAEPMYRRAIEQWRALGETGRLGITCSNLATLYRKTGLYKLAIETFAEAGRHIDSAFGANSQESVSYLVNLSEAYRVSGLLDESESSAAKALAISEEIFAPGDPRLSHTLHARAVVLQSRGQLDEATPLIQRSLMIREKAYGPDHPYIAATLTSLVSLYLEQGKYREAEPLALRALGVWEAKLGPEHPNTGVALNNLAQVYRFEQRYPEAEPLYRRAIQILEKLKSPEAAKPIANLADFYFDRGRLAAALALYQRCNEIVRTSFGDAAPQTDAIQLKIARLYSAMGRETEAARVYKRINQPPASRSFQPVR